MEADFEVPKGTEAGASVNGLDEILSSPLGSAALDFVAGTPLDLGPGYGLRARLLRGPGPFLRPAEALVLLAVPGTVVPLAQAVAGLSAFLEASGARRSRCRWLVLSDRAGIYLHEAVTQDPAWKRPGMRNRLCVVGSDSGTVSLGPGHSRNRALSERFRSLLEGYRLANRNQWKREASELFAFCLECMV